MDESPSSSAIALCPRARGRGVHKELIRSRLLTAKALDCDLATALTVPGSISQRNYERSGFQVAYTRLAIGRGRLNPRSDFRQPPIPVGVQILFSRTCPERSTATFLH